MTVVGEGTPEAVVTTSTDVPTHTNPVIDRINSSTDCAALQAEFDRADANRSLGSGELSISYMKAADARMKAVGCYGE